MEKLIIRSRSGIKKGGFLLPRMAWKIIKGKNSMEYEERQKALRDYQHMMNSGWRQGVSDGREEGVKAIIEMLQELGMSREETQTKVHDKFSASEETVQEWLNKYWK